MILKLIMAGAIAYGGYYAYENYYKPSKAAPVVSPAVEKPDTAGLKKLECTLCKGLGRKTYRSGGSEIGYKCPVCDGAGARSIPANATACNRCKGMAKVVVDPNENARMVSQRCPLCQGSGIEKKVGSI